MRTYTIREYRSGKVDERFSRKPYKQEKRARNMAAIIAKNQLIEKVDILVKEYGENEKAGEYKESVINL